LAFWLAVGCSPADVDEVEVCVRLGSVLVALALAEAGADVLAPAAPVEPMPVLAVPGAPAVGEAVVVAVAVVVVVSAAAVVTVRVLAGAAEPEPPARLTSAAASTPSASTSTTASAATRPFQLGDAANRVRAAAPQLRHHS
jgi:hypothetical protein